MSKEQEKKEQEKQQGFKSGAQERLENRTLSEKYHFLTAFQFLIGLSMIIYTYFFITTISELSKYKVPWHSVIIPYLIFLFNSICVISIVNFLFNLDNNKSDKK